MKYITAIKYKTIEYYQQLDRKIKMISLSFDSMFKVVFSRHQDILKEFLILQFDLDLISSYTSIVIDNVELPNEIKKEYGKRVDMLARLNDNKIIANIEVNSQEYNGIKYRNCLYFGKLYSFALEKGEKPASAKNKFLYQLNLNANKYDNKFGEDVCMITSKNTGKPLIENYAIFIKNLAFYRNLYYTKHRKLTKSELWLVALTAKTFTELYEILVQVLSPEKLENFMEEVIIMSQNKMILKDWEEELLDGVEKLGIIENAENKGLEKGLAEGREERNEEIARNLYDMDMPIDYISKATGLSEEKIKLCVASNAVEYKKSSSKLSTMDDIKND